MSHDNLGRISGMCNELKGGKKNKKKNKEKMRKRVQRGIGLSKFGFVAFATSN